METTDPVSFSHLGKPAPEGIGECEHCRRYEDASELVQIPLDALRIPYIVVCPDCATLPRATLEASQT